MFSLSKIRVALTAAALACLAALAPAQQPQPSPQMTIYDFTVRTQDGADTPLSAYKGQVLLIVNTATRCGFTPQYNALQELYEQCREKGFSVLDFPCNQFGAQAPGSDREIHDFCTMRYKITFPQFSKVDVKGPNASPLFKLLCAQSPIKWNFTKFLIDREGNVVARFEPAEKMEAVKAAVEALL